jgi:hypothetical protein
MKKRKQIKYIHEGKYVAEVEVELVDSEDEWAPYLSLQDAYKLDDVREALRQGNLKTASQYARLFEMQPIAI